METLSYDVLLSLAPHLCERDLLNLATTIQALNEPLTNYAFKKALTEVPFNHDLKPLTYAIKNGDIQLLSRTLDFLDHFHPQGWEWSQYYKEGVGELLLLAAAHNLKSLEFLVQKYPLVSRKTSWNTPMFDHDFYTIGGIADNFTGEPLEEGEFPDGSMVEDRNWELVHKALEANMYDCATFLLKHHQPPLCPERLGLDSRYYNSATRVEFLITHGAKPSICALHDAAASDQTEPRVFDLLVQEGLEVNSPITFSHGGELTPLIMACRCLQPTSIEALLRLGANPKGVDTSYSIGRLHYGSRYLSPIPILTLLLTIDWEEEAVYWSRNGERFIQCFQLLLRYGAVTSIPLTVGNFLEILLLRLWRVICKAMMRKQRLLPSCEDRPRDQNQGVQSLLCALTHEDLTAWDEVYQIASEANAKPTDKAILINLFSDYQDNYGDLPGPAQLQWDSPFTLPDRYQGNGFVE